VFYSLLYSLRLTGNQKEKVTYSNIIPFIICVYIWRFILYLIFEAGRRCANLELLHNVHTLCMKRTKPPMTCNRNSGGRLEIVDSETLAPNIYQAKSYVSSHFARVHYKI